MRPAFPASHSMDRYFFAIDRDGHVAVFDTREAGAIPKIAFSGEGTFYVSQQLARLPRVAFSHDPRSRRMQDHPRQNHYSLRGWEQSSRLPDMIRIRAANERRTSC